MRDWENCQSRDPPAPYAQRVPGPCTRSLAHSRAGVGRDLRVAGEGETGSYAAITFRNSTKQQPRNCRNCLWVEFRKPRPRVEIGQRLALSSLSRSSDLPYGSYIDSSVPLRRRALDNAYRFDISTPQSSFPRTKKQPSPMTGNLTLSGIAARTAPTGAVSFFGYLRKYRKNKKREHPSSELIYYEGTLIHRSTKPAFSALCRTDSFRDMPGS